MPLFVPENKGCLTMLRNGKIADELEEIAPRQYALITVGHTVNHLFALRGCYPTVPTLDPLQICIRR